MRSSGGLAAWLALSVGLIAPAPAARADDNARALLFGSLDAGPSTFLNTGLKVAPDGLDRAGFTGLAVVGAGARRERGPALAGFPTLVRATLVGSVLGGYQSFHDWGVVGLFAGPEASVEALDGGGATRMLPARYGLRLQGEVWARPSTDTLVTATLVLGSARWEAFTRVSAGYRLFGAYVGPEASFYADRTGYQKISAGLHVTQVTFGRVSFRLSAGCLYENEVGEIGPYGAIAAWMPL